MAEPQIIILPFRDHHQPGIDGLMASIAEEYEETIFSPQSKSMKEVALWPGHHYWVACAGNAVLGTIGLCRLTDNCIELKRLFLHRQLRGKGIAQDLLNTVVTSAKSTGASAIYLGTMSQFKAAQAFYEKRGFVKIPESHLPIDFIANPLDSCFYKKEL